MFSALIAVLAGLVILRVGIAILRAFGRPVPAPPPPGEMRRVNLHYRCAICGAEVKMTRATDEVPAPPRHCLEDMELVAPID